MGIFVYLKNNFVCGEDLKKIIDGLGFLSEVLNLKEFFSGITDDDLPDVGFTKLRINVTDSEDSKVIINESLQSIPNVLIVNIDMSNVSVEIWYIEPFPKTSKRCFLNVYLFLEFIEYLSEIGFKVDFFDLNERFVRETHGDRRLAEVDNLQLTLYNENMKEFFDFYLDHKIICEDFNPGLIFVCVDKIMTVDAIINNIQVVLDKLQISDLGIRVLGSFDCSRHIIFLNLTTNCSISSSGVPVYFLSKICNSLIISGIFCACLKLYEFNVEDTNQVLLTQLDSEPMFQFVSYLI